MGEIRCLPNNTSFSRPTLRITTVWKLWQYSAFMNTLLLHPLVLTQTNIAAAQTDRGNPKPEKKNSFDKSNKTISGLGEHKSLWLRGVISLPQQYYRDKVMNLAETNWRHNEVNPARLQCCFAFSREGGTQQVFLLVVEHIGWIIIFRDSLWEHIISILSTMAYRYMLWIYVLAYYRKTNMHSSWPVPDIIVWNSQKCSY